MNSCQLHHCTKVDRCGSSPSSKGSIGHPVRITSCQGQSYTEANNATTCKSQYNQYWLCYIVSTFFKAICSADGLHVSSSSSTGLYRYQAYIYIYIQIDYYTYNNCLQVLLEADTLSTVGNKDMPVVWAASPKQHDLAAACCPPTIMTGMSDNFIMDMCFHA